MTIEQETFEAWLFAQPDERTFCYQNNTDCLCCKYMKEVHGAKYVLAGNLSIQVDGTLSTIPNFVQDTLLPFVHNPMFNTTTFKEVKTRYRQLFPDFDGEKTLKTLSGHRPKTGGEAVLSSPTMVRKASLT